MLYRLENGDLKANCGNMPVEIVPAVIQAIEALGQKIFFWMRRSLKGRNVACVRSNEIAPRLMNDAIGETVRKATIIGTSF